MSGVGTEVLEKKLKMGLFIMSEDDLVRCQGARLWGAFNGVQINNSCQVMEKPANSLDWHEPMASRPPPPDAL